MKEVFRKGAEIILKKAFPHKADQEYELFVKFEEKAIRRVSKVFYISIFVFANIIAGLVFGFSNEAILPFIADVRIDRFGLIVFLVTWFYYRSIDSFLESARETDLLLEDDKEVKEE